MGTKVRKLGDPSKQAVYSIARNRNILAYAYEGGVDQLPAHLQPLQRQQHQHQLCSAIL